MIAVLVVAFSTCLEVVAPVVSAFEPRLSARRRFCKKQMVAIVNGENGCSREIKEAHERALPDRSQRIVHNGPGDAQQSANARRRLPRLANRSPHGKRRIDGGRRASDRGEALRQRGDAARNRGRRGDRQRDGGGRSADRDGQFWHGRGGGASMQWCRSPPAWLDDVRARGASGEAEERHDERPPAEAKQAEAERDQQTGGRDRKRERRMRYQRCALDAGHAGVQEYLRGARCRKGRLLRLYGRWRCRNFRHIDKDGTDVLERGARTRPRLVQLLREAMPIYCISNRDAQYCNANVSKASACHTLES
jgi:hypothetical protein